MSERRFTEEAAYKFGDLCFEWRDLSPYYVQKHMFDEKETGEKETGWANIWCFSDDKVEILGEMPLNDINFHHGDGDVPSTVKKRKLKLEVILSATCAWEDRTTVTKTKKDGKLYITIQ